MVFHVGIYPWEGEVAVYNEINKETTIFKVTEDNEENNVTIDKMFAEIKAIINDEIGYTCLFMDDISSNYYKCGKKYGFFLIQAVGVNRLVYMSYCFRAKCKPNSGDIIWIIYDDSVSVWQKTETKAKIICVFTNNSLSTEDDFLEIKKDLGTSKDPNIIIIDKVDEEKFNVLRTGFPQCDIFMAEGKISFAEAALIKARISAMDSEVLKYDTLAQLHKRLKVKKNEECLTTFNEFELLPLEKTVSVPIEENEKALTIVIEAYDNNEDPFNFYKLEIAGYEMLIGNEFIFTIKFDENKTFSYDYSVKEKHEISLLKNFYLKNSQFKKIFKIPPKFLLSKKGINAIGIDLGTSQCYAAMNRRNGIETIALDNAGERQLPSYVSLNDKFLREPKTIPRQKKNRRHWTFSLSWFKRGFKTFVDNSDPDQPYVSYNEKYAKCGQILIDQLQTSANNLSTTVYDSKRIIGRNFNDIKIDKNWPFEIMNVVKKQSLIKFKNESDYFHVPPEEISAILLSYIKQKAEDFQGNELTEVVITVPATFTGNQKFATHLSALLAGWETVHLLPEPVAASIAYFIDRPIPKSFKMLLFDFGGGTLDICIFKIEKETLQIISQAGDTDLGGRNFDNILFEHFSQLLKEKHEISVNLKDKLKFRLLQKCVKIKHTLTVQKEAVLDVNDFNTNIEDNIIITRVEFEKMSAELLIQVKEVIFKVLSDANFTSKDIHKVLLAGGSSRMPMVKMLLQDMFKNSEHACQENPDEVVAIGAAYYAYYLQASNERDAQNPDMPNFGKKDKKKNCPVM